MSELPVVDWENLKYRAKSIFTPAAPINEAELFAGRKSQIQRLLDAIAERGRHAVLFGERGVGKTSLTNIFNKIINSSQIIPIRKQLSPQDTFESLWRKVFRDLTFEIRKPGNYGNEEVQQYSIADKYPAQITPDDVVRELGSLANVGIPVIIFDEFDKTSTPSTKQMMSHTLKAISDSGVNATVVVVGVADDITTLVEEHESLKRNLEEIKMPRMSKDELNEILTKRIAQLGMEIDGDARWKIVVLSRGLPEYVHSLGKHAVLQALELKKMKVLEADVDTAITMMLVKSEQSTNNDYKKAVQSNKKNALYREILLACALAGTDDEGKFTPTAVMKPLESILKRKVELSGFQRHLAAFCEGDRGRVLEKIGTSRAFKYRFREPKMQPYVIKRGIDAKIISKEALSSLAAPEQPKLSADF
jgi:Cdc6-like AAA superfamily ATPase